MRTAILIPCYNRPQYLEQVLADIIAMPQVRMGTPVILACDGGENAAVAENLAVAVKSKIPALHCLVRPEHMGIGRNVYEAKRYAFEECQFDAVYYVEDDIRLSPHTLTLLLNLHKWLQANYTNACIIGTATHCAMSLEEKQANLALVADCGAMLNNHLLTREHWNMMRPWMSEYVRQFLQCAYRDRDSERITEWVKALAQRLPVQCGNRMFPVHWPFKEYFLDKPVSSQDGAMALSIRLAGFAHVVTVVNRGWHIGKQGENASEEWWDRTYGTTTLDIFEEDNTRTYFRARA
jgi:hypothetical protein